jgi:ligand-binding sensor domain-containing protein
MGTSAGLRVLRAGEVISFGPDANLPQSAIHGILEDDSQRLWISMSRGDGVWRVSRGDLEAWLADRSSLPAIAEFGSADGILGNEGNGPQSCAKGLDGRLWFAKGEGLVVVDPAECPTAPAPRVFIEAVVADGEQYAAANSAQPIDLADWRVKLARGRGRHLEFLFAATTLHSPERVRVRFKLDGH